MKRHSTDVSHSTIWIWFGWNAMTRGTPLIPPPPHTTPPPPSPSVVWSNCLRGGTPTIIERWVYGNLRSDMYSIKQRRYIPTKALAPPVVIICDAFSLYNCITVYVGSWQFYRQTSTAVSAAVIQTRKIVSIDDDGGVPICFNKDLLQYKHTNNSLDLTFLLNLTSTIQSTVVELCVSHPPLHLSYCT